MRSPFSTKPNLYHVVDLFVALACGVSAVDIRFVGCVVAARRDQRVELERERVGEGEWAARVVMGARSVGGAF